MTHLVAILICVAGITSFVVIGLGAKSAGWSRQYEMAIGLVSACLLAFKYAWYWCPASGLEPFLPLHLCNLSELLALLSLLTRWYWFRSVLHFWSLGAVIAFVTPDVPGGPGTLAYWLFFVSHALIVGVAVYDVIVAGFRPRGKDLGVTIAVTLCYLAMVLPVDIVWDENYAYVGPTRPSVPTVVDSLGPWPLRVVWIALITASVFALAWAPWALVGRARDDPHPNDLRYDSPTGLC
jgi:hypothetical integral membrane protein (TIGR02206 family)